MSSLPGVETTAAPFSVAVVDDDPKLRTRLAMQLGEAARAAAYPSLQAVEELALSGTPAVLVLGPSVATPDHFTTISRLTRSRSIAAVAVVHELSTEVLQQAIRAGVSDVVALGDPGVLLEAIGRAAETLQAAPPVEVPLAAVPTAGGTPGAGAGAEGRGRLVTVFSTKGGAGKSFVATNLGVILAKRSPHPVVLVDADLQFGDVAVMLKLTPQHTILEAVQQGDGLDADLLRSLLVRHESGLLVLPAPVEPAFADHVGLADMLKIISLLRTFAGHVIVDTPAYFTDVVLGILEEADDIVLMAGMDIPHIKNTKIGLQTLRLLNIPAAKVKLALNRANSRVKLDIAEVEKTLQMKADCLLPSDIAVPQSINKGLPIAMDAPRSGVTRNLERLADMFPAFAAASSASTG